MSAKYIFVTGGVISSLGKGLTAASIAMLLESRGLKVAMLKLDPYLNVDPGTMNPLEHGEVYVSDDGAEADLDLGHYYRFTNATISKAFKGDNVSWRRKCSLDTPHNLALSSKMYGIPLTINAIQILDPLF